MRPLFLSYKRRPWQQEALELSIACRRRGVRTLVDVSDPVDLAGVNQIDTLRETVRDNCDGLILYFTRDVKDSPMIWNVEVPAALDALDRGDYSILPFFRDMSPSEASRLQPYGARLASMGGVPAIAGNGDGGAWPSPLLVEAHAELARRALGIQLRRYLPRIAGRPIDIIICTRPTGFHDSSADLVIDWTEDFRKLMEGQAAQQAPLRVALSDIAPALAGVGIGEIRLHGPAHLSAALTFGHTFNRATGFQLHAVQHQSIWSADGPVGADRLRISSHGIDPSRTDVLLILALSRPELISDADASSVALGLPIASRIAIQPTEGPSRNAITDGSHARAIVRATTDALMRARAQLPARGTVHLYIAAPFAFAALLGHALNAFSPVQLYEHSPARDGYIPTFTIA